MTVTAKPIRPAEMAKHYKPLLDLYVALMRIEKLNTGAALFAAATQGEWTAELAVDLAANPPAKPEPVLRWEGDNLMLGGEEVGFALPESDELFFWRSNLAARVGKCPTLTEARTAAEQAVRDWLKRAGCV